MKEREKEKKGLIIMKGGEGGRWRRIKFLYKIKKSRAYPFFL